MKIYNYFLIIITALVSLANFWIWRIIKADFILALALFFISIFLAFLVINNSRKIKLVLVLLLILITIRILYTGFDDNFRLLSPDQYKQLNQRHEYYASDLGILFQNKAVLRIYKDITPYLNIYAANIFNSLSPNLYFFSNHPREREKVDEFVMYPSFFVIFFLIGFIFFLNNSKSWVIGYFVLILLILGFVRQNYIFGPILLFPLINLCIGIGVLRVYSSLRS